MCSDDSKSSSGSGSSPSSGSSNSRSHLAPPPRLEPHGDADLFSLVMTDIDSDAVNTSQTPLSSPPSPDPIDAGEMSKDFHEAGHGDPFSLVDRMPVVVVVVASLSASMSPDMDTGAGRSGSAGREEKQEEEEEGSDGDGRGSKNRSGSGNGTSGGGSEGKKRETKTERTVYEDSEFLKRTDKRWYEE
ncbi:hypothetical protein MKZ38_002847 [Zalerion maritima]|uniref:Uncharacterized protein n=1 Tax=Zalerion maritima TaxID=339359 RepID=A0AAD5WXP7_9PEZI|nr:hypothetical protein MKZ38_002847 [Zalerion maritima]